MTPLSKLFLACIVGVWLCAPLALAIFAGLTSKRTVK